MDKKLPAEPLMDAETDEVPGYQFTNPDPYAKCAPLPEDHIQHRTRSMRMDTLLSRIRPPAGFLI